jgi:hypothetical protein
LGSAYGAGSPIGLPDRSDVGGKRLCVTQFFEGQELEIAERCSWSIKVNDRQRCHQEFAALVGPAAQRDNRNCSGQPASSLSF